MFSRFKETIFYSSINGVLTLRRYWRGDWFLKIADGEYYSGTYLESMWRFLIKKRSKGLLPKNVLILGSGGGCAVQVAKTVWPQCTIDALDYDPEMIAISKQIYGFNTKEISFIIAEANAFISDCVKQYDCVVIDLFCGNKVAPLLKNRGFVLAVRKILSSSGFVLVNIASGLSGKDKEMVSVWQDLFLNTKIVEYRQNLVLVAEESNIPFDYYDIFQDVSYAKMLQKRGLIVAGDPHSQYVITPLPFWLCVVNAMHTDNEVDIEIIRKLGYRHGLIFWTTWRKKHIGVPWRKSYLPLHQKGSGFVFVREAYKDSWSQMVRRNLKKFEKCELSIEEATLSEFIRGLREAYFSSFLKDGFSNMIQAMDETNMKLLVVKKGENICGGLAVVNYASVSAHFVAFLSKDGKRNQVGVGLIDYWYQYALKHNIKYLNFGHIWQRGEPLSWRGYSVFKRKFIDEEINVGNGFFRFF